MIRVAVVDDHAIVRSGLCQLLKMQVDMEVVGEGGTGREALDLVRELKPDVLLLDVDLPDIDGLQVTDRVSDMDVETAVLILTMYESEDIAERALSSGAMGYLIKGTDPEELPKAVRAVAAGRPYVTQAIGDRMLMRKIRPGAAGGPVSMLSNRELQVLVEIARGKNTNEIAEKLCLSASTVKTYRKRLGEKLGFDNVSDIVKFCIRHGLIDKY